MTFQGNFGGKRQTRKTYDNVFCCLSSALIEQAPKKNRRFYEPTTRGIAEALGIDLGTFHRYNSGQSKAPEVLFDHMHILSAGQAPEPTFWDHVALLRITPV